MGEPVYRYYAELEFADKDAFKARRGPPEFAATGKDAMEMGGPFSVLFATFDLPEPAAPRPVDPASSASSGSSTRRTAPGRRSG